MINNNHITNTALIKQNFHSNKPYPHIVLDNFLEEVYANYIIEEMKKNVVWHPTADAPEENNKFYSPMNDKESIDELNLKCPITFSTINFLKSQECRNFISEITGINDLISDIGFTGSGLHKTCNTGRLSLHIDFNQNWNTNLFRRVNLLIYLNKDWKEEYNGHLELWNVLPWRREQNISPLFNRAVIFNTTKESYHGHPIPLSCPEDVARYSIATYYYTEKPADGDQTFRPLTFVK